MDRDTSIRLAEKAGLEPRLWNHTDAFERFAALVAEHKEKEMQEHIDALFALYEQACQQRDQLMDGQRAQIEAWKQLATANEIVFKAVANRTHWKRTASRYLKKNALDWYLQAKEEWEKRGDPNERFY